MELGNHTYSHPDLHRMPLDDFEKDARPRRRDDEAAPRRRADRRSATSAIRFSTPGVSLEVKRGLEAFLAERGYTIAPVTHDNGEWIFAAAYANAGNARRRGGSEEGARGLRVRTWTPSSTTSSASRRRSSAREIPQILLIHANSLNADAYPELARMMRDRGYRFVPLAETLKDPVFRDTPDTFTGAGGISWLHRWALTRGGKDAVLPGRADGPEVRPGARRRRRRVAESSTNRRWPSAALSSYSCR